MSARDLTAEDVLAVAFLDIWRLPLRDRPQAILSALSGAGYVVERGDCATPAEVDALRAERDDAQARADAMAHQLGVEARERDTLRARVKTLESVLRPFADAAEAASIAGRPPWEFTGATPFEAAHRSLATPQEDAR